MKIVSNRRALWAAPLAAAVLLAGCGTLSNVDRDGKTDEPVFPEAEKVTLHTGTFPNLADLNQVQDGVTRDQIYDLLGRPHFAEGFQVREWDYLFHFRTAEGIKTCQFKILFDSDKVARSFYWAPEDCRPQADATPSPAPVVVAPQKYSLGSDVGFAFGSATLTAAGSSRIAEIARELKQQKTIDQLEVVGHTDRIGSVASNDLLSQRRADAVRHELVANGIPAANIRAYGYGPRQPLVQCDQDNRAELISCLAPNRRVDIQASGIR
ncbi:OmpA family protein [Pseudomonas sp. S 311-6]|jgi:outer membrane protein OmpA-like peptidoglycan-associated protein|uniref:OmpA family protein n=1 Tax=Kerstersia gyiorum TaxID=206506 RepID=UPI000FD771E6|nr:OmpA family protein [Kerstersia gyiorum]AZV94034.1 lipoprotein PlpD [Bordetella sp. J329]MCH4273095.1 OmpA family protein [Kerstersia gyiorum]MCO7641944.1 OmpA family protein [Pseudomonas sp. S 311-6]QBR41014.1 outer membrane protein assembly factor BamE [Kerstersia gyiorum]